jgi:hypothetical protein
MRIMCDKMTLFGREFKKPLFDHDDGRIWSMTIGVLKFRIHLHGETYPNSPWSGYTGSVHVAGETLVQHYQRDDLSGFPKEPHSVLLWLEAEGKRIASEMDDIAKGK